MKFTVKCNVATLICSSMLKICIKCPNIGRFSDRTLSIITVTGEIMAGEVNKKFKKIHEFERDMWPFVPLTLSRHLVIVNSDQAEIQRIMNECIGTSEISVADMVAMAHRYKAGRYYAHAIVAYYFASQV